MTEEIFIAIFGALASVLLAFLTAYFTSRSETQKLNHRLLENLYEKRYQTYTKLLEITQEIGKNTKDTELCKNARKELKEWQKTSGGFLLMSKKTLDSFDVLKDVLKKNPEKGNEYSEAQRKNIWEARNKFRGALRDEFEFFHSAEKSI